MTKHVMLDLETLGTGPTSAVISIGAAAFDPWGKADSITQTFDQHVNIESAMKYGRVDAGALKFWVLHAPDSARVALRVGQREKAVDLDEALIGFTDWLNFAVRPDGALTDSVCVWGDGATFDNVLLRNAYTVTGLDCPWGYRMDRCFRTLKNMSKYKPKTFDGTAHDAADDARHQALWLQKIVKRNKITVL